jgi:uncharacterized DUF497 family protein
VLESDKAKRLKNLSWRGLDFADADLVLDGRLAPWAVATECDGIVRRGSTGQECGNVNN